MQTITTTARRITRAHNQCGGSLVGGVLVFDRDGRGGEWYSPATYGFGGDTIVYTVRPRRVTEAEVQDWLDIWLT